MKKFMPILMILLLLAWALPTVSYSQWIGHPSEDGGPLSDLMPSGRQAEKIKSSPEAALTIKGEVMDNGKLLSEEGEEYTIAEAGKGEEVLEMAGKTVRIKGTVAEQEGEKIITIISYTEEQGASD